jgi:hypothetical protein
VESALIDIGAVYAQHVLGPMLQPDRQPDASSAADIENAPYRNLLGQMANDMVCRYCRGAVGRFKEAVVISVQLKDSRRLAARPWDHARCCQRRALWRSSRYARRAAA